ncbi:MAG: DNA-binding domain-containing protein [Gammaproteobacteria bacterium]|jgi:hypothetical protein
MKHLARLQHVFQNCVLQADKSCAASWVSASGRADPETRLSVYRHAYRSRLKEVLANDYPAVLMAIGDNQFNRLADDYIDAHPSLYYSLRDFGHHLSAFVSDAMQQHEDWQGMHWLYELALFERTLGEAFDAADDAIFSEQDMAGIAPEAWPELRFHMHPSVNRLDLEWNVPEMWQALTADSPAQVTAIRESASPWLVWRDQLITRFRSMQADEQLALDKLRAGDSFSQACEALATLMSEDEVPLRAAGLLKSWMVQGLISGIQ